MMQPIRKIIVTALLWVIISGAFGQINTGFEEGLRGWGVTGSTGNVRLDSSNAHTGRACVKLGEAAGELSQRLDVQQFSVVRYDAYVKCSAEGVRAHSFIRFYDSADNLLLAYKSAAFSWLFYQSTANYTETPAGTSYMTVGISKETEGGFVYADDFTMQVNIGTPSLMHPPVCNLDQYMRPFWKSDTIFNETVLLYAENGQPATGRLLFQPSKILSVQRFDLAHTYVTQKDYVFEKNAIKRRPQSAMPFRADTSFNTKDDLAWYDLKSQWVVVSYMHKDAWPGPQPSYKGNRMPHTMQKLRSGSPLRVIAYGMSITRGLDVSSYDTVSPYMPTYVDLFARQLRRIYHHNQIVLYNAGLPGSAVDWAADYAEKYLNPIKPDLVIIDFGMNDFWRIKPEAFKGYIETIIRKVRGDNPDAEFILLSNMKFDPEYIHPDDPNSSFYLSNMTGYSKVLQEMEAEGIVNLDMTTLSGLIYALKKPKDCLANPLHPNDYLARWYAQAMTALLSAGTD